jgi:hypothetical protein
MNAKRLSSTARFAWASLVTLSLHCACAGKASYDECSVAAGGIANSDAGLGGAGATGGAGGTDTGGSTTVICPDTPDASQSYCPQITASYDRCSVIRLKVDHQSWNILLVVDRSSSMNEPHPPGSGYSKWDTMVAALGASLTDITGYSFTRSASGTSIAGPMDVTFGLELFPYDPITPVSATDVNTDLACRLPAENGAVLLQTSADGTQLSALFDLLSAQIPGGRSPTVEALLRAQNYFTSGYGQCLSGNRTVLLATNGSDDCYGRQFCPRADGCGRVPNISCAESANCCVGSGSLCPSDSAVVDAIHGLHSIGVKTVVVGNPSTEEDRASLNAYALAGQMPNPNGADGNGYYPIADGSTITDLVDEFRSLQQPFVRTCDIELTETSLDRFDAKVFIDCQEIYETSPDAGTGGYFFDANQSPPHLRFTHSTCDSIMSHGAQQVDVMLCSLALG